MKNENGDAVGIFKIDNPHGNIRSDGRTQIQQGKDGDDKRDEPQRG